MLIWWNTCLWIYVYAYILENTRNAGDWCCWSYQQSCFAHSLSIQHLLAVLKSVLDIQSECQITIVAGGVADGGTDERKSVRSELSCSGVILLGKITLFKPSCLVRINFEVSHFHLDQIYFSNNWGFTHHLQKLNCNFAAGNFSPLRNSLTW